MMRLTGLVIPGEGEGRNWGFPTANIAIDGRYSLPVPGTYRGWYFRESIRYPAAIYIGRPPFEHEGEVVNVVEAFILDFDGDLYGEWSVVDVLERIRPDQKFDGPEQLVEAIKRDVEVVRARQNRSDFDPTV
jgi:riboflavin kinase/FMN adenylyltransferase